MDTPPAKVFTGDFRAKLGVHASVGGFVRPARNPLRLSTRFPKVWLLLTLRVRLVLQKHSNPELGGKGYMPGLYVHVPFCKSKCDYCAFYSVPLKGIDIDIDIDKVNSSGTANSLIQTYLQGVNYEIAMRQGDAPQGVSSLFIGGGTPTVLSASDLEGLLQALHKGVVISDAVEKTVESNPGTLTPEKLKVLRKYGINRISLGAQSFCDEILERIGRIHRTGEIREAVAMIRAAGFKNLNLDLMFGLPGQTIKLWQDTVEEAIQLAPEHLSLYALSLEEGTPLESRYKGVKSKNDSEIHDSQRIEPETSPEQFAFLPDDDLQADMYDWAVIRLEKAGYIHYEVSNFALPGKECRHNLEIWRGGEYLGLGPGAVSCLKGIRGKNIENIREYAKRGESGMSSVDEKEKEMLSYKELMAERMILGLRLNEGVNIQAFRKDFGIEITDIYSNVLERYVKQGVLSIRNGYLYLSPQFYFTANSILQNFV